jgi:hypothetical protein
MPTNDDAVEPVSSISTDLDDIRERLNALLVDLDSLSETIAAAHVQAALDCLGSKSRPHAR